MSLISASSLTSPCRRLIDQSRSKKHKSLRRTGISRAAQLVCLTVGVEDVAQVLHNKVLISSVVASGIGQLAKPFTAVLYGRRLDFKAAIGSGGMPSTHSAAVVAAATVLGLERGFSDSIFGISVVFAAIVMYDAQGVRKEVGLHARVINTSVITSSKDRKSLSNETCLDIPIQDFSLVSSPTTENGSFYQSNSVPLEPLSKKTNTITNLKAFAPSKFMVINGEQESTISSSHFLPLKETVGHTKLQVFVGALLGFFVSLVLSISL